MSWLLFSHSVTINEGLELQKGYNSIITVAYPKKATCELYIYVYEAIYLDVKLTFMADITQKLLRQIIEMKTDHYKLRSS